ncbi:MAG: LuxR C-terminal-related transcriptional regulator [Anaerolineaceae bacterium]|nr:LuxR C-terminal-related transcriptional regulator [Anaerolineaceae bacterium]
MAFPILVTKLFIPQPRPELVNRQRLIDQLNHGRNNKLTLVSAPAGFGKTTLVSAWVNSLDSKERVCWYSLGVGDNDPTQFLLYLVSAFQMIEPVIGKEVISALRSPHPPPPQAVLTTVINDLAALQTQIMLVLDDYHLIKETSVHEAVAFLVENMPPVFHFVIITREDPFLPIARLRAHGQLTELRAADLRFTTDEAAQFLNHVMGLTLSEQDVSALEERTEGWIAGLQLAAVSLQGQENPSAVIEAFTGSNRLVLDYLIEDVLEQQPETIQNFLLQTSILHRLNSSLCNAITGQTDSQTILEELEHANMFLVPLDHERGWYRYQHLFAELLRRRLYQTDKNQALGLHEKASQWAEKNGFYDAAVEYAQQAENYQRTVALLAEHGDDFWIHGEHAKLRYWLARLPEEWMTSSPHLCIYNAWYRYAVGQYTEADFLLQCAEEKINQGSDTPAEQHQLLKGRLAAIRSLMGTWTGDGQSFIENAKFALQVLPEKDPWRGPAAIALGDAYLFMGEIKEAQEAQINAIAACNAVGDIFFTIVANLKLAATLRAQGKLNSVVQICQQQLALAERNGIAHMSVIGWLYEIWGDVLIERNQLKEALPLIIKGTELTQNGDLSLDTYAKLTLVKALYDTGDFEGVNEILMQLELLDQGHAQIEYLSKSLASWRIWIAPDIVQSSQQWLSMCGLKTDDPLTISNENEYRLLVKTLLITGSIDEAYHLSRRLLDQVEGSQRILDHIETLLMMAMTTMYKENIDQAIGFIKQALHLTEEEGFIRIFVKEGQPIAQLLYEALSRQIKTNYVRQILSAFPTEKEQQFSQKPRLRSDEEWIELLSERELDVLAFLAKGLSNSDIAKKLYLSLNTVKAHTRNIYRKLNVSSRTQATAKARVLGLLSDQ